MADIVIGDVTDGTVAGDGIFDLLMAAGKAHLEIELDANRITGKEYSTVYLGMMQSAMAQAIQFLTMSKQGDLLAQKKITEAAQTTDSTGGTTKKQQDLIQAQTDGFARDAEQKLMKVASDVYNINRSALGSSATIPTALVDTALSAFVENAATGAGVTLPP